MPTLEPIVVNPPKEKKTYTYSENDIVDIVAQAIKQGKIEAGAGFEEVEVKFYYSDFSIHDNQTHIVNAEKKEILNNLVDKILAGKFANEIITFPTPLDTIISIESIPFSQVTIDAETVWLSNFNARLQNPETIACGIARWTGDMVLTFSNFNSQSLNALIAGMATDPTKYISLKFRVEK